MTDLVKLYEVLLKVYDLHSVLCWAGVQEVLEINIQL